MTSRVNGKYVWNSWWSGEVRGGSFSLMIIAVTGCGGAQNVYENVEK